jgi:hypothetical protein
MQTPHQERALRHSWGVPADGVHGVDAGRLLSLRNPNHQTRHRLRQPQQLTAAETMFSTSSPCSERVWSIDRH